MIWVSWEKYIPLTRIVKGFMKQHIKKGWFLANNIHGCPNLQIGLHRSFRLEFIEKSQFPLGELTRNQFSLTLNHVCLSQGKQTYLSKGPSLINNRFCVYIQLTAKSKVCLGWEGHARGVEFVPGPQTVPRSQKALNQCVEWMRGWTN